MACEQEPAVNELFQVVATFRDDAAFDSQMSIVFKTDWSR